MPGLDNLTNSIIQSAKDEAQAVSDAAEAEAREALAKAEARAKAEAERILTAAKAEAARAAGRAAAAKKAAARDRLLAAKQATLARVFDAALERLNAMRGEAFREFLYRSLKSSPMAAAGGCELLLPEGCGVTIAEANAFLKGEGLPEAAAYSGAARLGGGFALYKGGVAERRDFAALISHAREGLTADVAAILF